MTPQNLQGLTAQLAALGEFMQQSLQRVEANIADINQRLRGIENREAGCQPLITQRLDAAWRAIDELKAEQSTFRKAHSDEVAAIKTAHEDEVTSLKQRLSKAESRLGLVVGIGSLAGSAIIVWLFNNWLGLIK
jgi:argininosuccinate lyase